MYTAIAKPHHKTGLVYTTLKFSTLSFPFLNMYRELYYSPSYGSGSRVLPPNLQDHFTAISLAYRISDDGSNNNGALILCTYRYSLAQVEFLCEMLRSKFGINCHPQGHKSYYRIYIPKGEMDKVRALVSPYMVQSMLYKIR